MLVAVLAEVLSPGCNLDNEALAGYAISRDIIVPDGSCWRFFANKKRLKKFIKQNVNRFRIKHKVLQLAIDRQDKEDCDRYFKEAESEWDRTHGYVTGEDAHGYDDSMSATADMAARVQELQAFDPVQAAEDLSGVTWPKHQRI
jgi:hypothetical protein